mmetsp:Transcript_105541/g.303515  ORF Transcript_105541/g.303515 Transcript_105541/m.303515 type:complete len:560 (+) Transcript_105541:68-1747(+)
MIEYPDGKFHPWMLFQIRGSVFPHACLAALLPTAIAIALEHFAPELDGSSLGLSLSDTVESQVWVGVTSLLGFVMVFRTSQAYSRFWEGTSAVYQIVGEWIDAASSLVAFCKCSNADNRDVAIFQHTLVRLLSMLNALVLMDLAGASSEGVDNGRAFGFELIDAKGIDQTSLLTLNESDHKVELVFHWINQLVVENNSRGIFSVQPPILTRAFQELASGMVRYHEAMKLAKIPLPFPYVQTMELLLMLHWIFTPLLTCMWVQSTFWAGTCTFLQVFVVWSLNCIAGELENPFGEDVNDLPVQQLQREMNDRLMLLLRPSTQRTARLSESAVLEEENGHTDGRLPTSGSLERFGVAGLAFATLSEARRNRRISWGHLQEAIADEALVEVAYEEDAGASAEQDEAESAPLSARRRMVIREVKTVSSFDAVLSPEVAMSNSFSRLSSPVINGVGKAPLRDKMPESSLPDMPEISAEWRSSSDEGAAAREGAPERQLSGDGACGGPGPLSPQPLPDPASCASSPRTACAVEPAGGAVPHESALVCPPSGGRARGGASRAQRDP